MKKLNKNQIILYCVTVIILFSIPIYTIIVNTNTLKDGKEFLFKVEAFDPYDMFRGNYLNINFKENSVVGNFDSISNYSNDVYVTIDTDNDGFAYFKELTITKPTETSYYYKTTGYYNEYNSTFRVETPTRYYMNEDKSLKAEEIYNDNIDNTYVKVRVKDGAMIIVGVYVNDVLIDTID